MRCRSLEVRTIQFYISLPFLFGLLILENEAMAGGKAVYIVSVSYGYVSSCLSVYSLQAKRNTSLHLPQGPGTPDEGQSFADRSAGTG